MLILAACNLNSAREKLNKKHMRYFINEVNGKNAYYMYVENGNDTIYAYMHCWKQQHVTKIKGTEKELKLIKKLVRKQLNPVYYEDCEIDDREHYVNYFIESSRKPVLLGSSNSIKCQQYGPVKNAEFIKLIHQLEKKDSVFCSWGKGESEQENIKE